jgi:L-ornithine N5-oxygenase
VTGASEHTHGLSSTLLSNVAVRAGEILESVLSNTVDLGSESVPESPSAPTRHLKAEPSAREAS